MIELYIKGQRVELTGNETIALTYAANDLRSLSSRNSAYSNTFELPPTSSNLALIDSAHVMNSAGLAPYRRLPALISSNGASQIDGFAEVDHTTPGSISINISGDNAVLVDLIGDANLSDLDLTELNHDWTWNNVVSGLMRAYAQGYAYCAIDYGQFTQRPVNGDLSGSVALYHELFPVVYVRYLLEKILSQHGYTLTGNILNNGLFNKMILPIVEGSPKHSQEYLDTQQLTLSCNNTQAFGDLMPTPVPDFTGPIFDITTQTPGYYTLSTIQRGGRDLYTLIAPTKNVRAKMRVRGTLVRSGSTSAPLSVQLLAKKGIIKNLAGFDGLQSKPDVYANSQNSSKTYFFKPGESTVSIDWTSDVFDILPSERVTLQVVGSGFFEQNLTFQGGQLSLEREETILPGDRFEVGINLPDISQKDLLLTIVNQFDLLIQTDATRKVVRMDLFDTLLSNIASAKDWSDRIDISKLPEVYYQFGDFAQNSVFRYAADDSDPYLKANPDYAAGSLNVDNENLSSQETVFESALAATTLQTTFQGAATLPFVPLFSQKEDATFSVWDSTATYFTSPVQDYVVYRGRYFRALVNGITNNKPPLYDEGGETKLNSGEWVEGSYVKLLAKGIYTGNTPTPRVLWLDTTANDDQAIYVHDGNSNFASVTTRAAFTPLGFDNSLLKDYYKAIRRMLDQTRLLRIYLRLNAADIASLDFSVPVYLEATIPGMGKVRNYFYLNTVQEYTPGDGESTLVELVRL